MVSVGIGGRVLWRWDPVGSLLGYSTDRSACILISSQTILDTEVGFITQTQYLLFQGPAKSVHGIHVQGVAVYSRKVILKYTVLFHLEIVNRQLSHLFKLFIQSGVYLKIRKLRESILKDLIGFELVQDVIISDYWNVWSWFSWRNWQKHKIMKKAFWWLALQLIRVLENTCGGCLEELPFKCFLDEIGNRLCVQIQHGFAWNVRPSCMGISVFPLLWPNKNTSVMSNNDTHCVSAFIVQMGTEIDKFRCHTFVMVALITLGISQWHFHGVGLCWYPWAVC